MQLTRIDGRARQTLAGETPLGDYTRAHLLESRARIKRALEAGRDIETAVRAVPEGQPRREVASITDGPRLTHAVRGGPCRHRKPRNAGAGLIRRLNFGQNLPPSSDSPPGDAWSSGPRRWTRCRGVRFLKGVPVIVATQLKVGNVIMHNGKPHRVTNVST